MQKPPDTAVPTVVHLLIADIPSDTDEVVAFLGESPHLFRLLSPTQLRFISRFLGKIYATQLIRALMAASCGRLSLVGFLAPTDPLRMFVRHKRLRSLGQERLRVAGSRIIACPREIQILLMFQSFARGAVADPV